MSDVQVAPAPADTANPDANAQAADAWTASLAPELKQLVTDKGYKTPADVVQAYAHAQRAIGADRIPVPKDGIWDDVAREKLGIPKDPSGYKLAKPELPPGVVWDDATEKAAMPLFHKLGLTPAQANGLLEFYAGQQVAQHTTLTQAQEQKAQELAAGREDAIKGLKTEWGQKYDQNINFASRAVQHIGGEDLVKVMNETGLGDNPVVVKAFAKIGELLGEDVLKVGKADGVMTPAEAQAEARRLMALPEYTSKDPVVRAAAVKKVNDLFGMSFDNTTDIRRGAHVAA